APDWCLRTKGQKIGNLNTFLILPFHLNIKIFIQLKRLMLRGLVSGFLIMTAFNSLQAQVRILSVDPSATSPSIESVHSAHIAAYDNNIPSKHRLILMIVGTGGYASGTRAMDSIFATMGYHVISLDYENNVITTVCSHSEDSSCFDHYRQEIITGDQ